MVGGHIEIFGGLLKFSPVLMCLNIILVLHFIFSWIYTYKKTGWKIDYWYFTLFLLFFVPVLLMYPFNASPLNYISVGSNYYRLVEFVDKAYLITITGYIKCMNKI